MRKLISFILMVSVFTIVYSQTAQSSLLLVSVLKQLKIDKKNINEAFYREKVLPNKTTSSVLVIPKYRTNETDEYGNLFLELDAYIVVADNTSGKIQYKYVEENAWTSDAIVLSDIEIDTGLYHLNENTRAFGVRVSYGGSSSPNPFHGTDLSLFAVQNNMLNNVLQNFKIDDFHGEWDTKCEGEFDDLNGSVTIDKNKTKGLNNLIIKQKIEHTKNYWADDDCKEKKTNTTATKILKYNGKEYK